MNESEAFACLETASGELNQLLYGPVSTDKSTDHLLRLWLNKVIGAGMDDIEALMFLSSRLAEELHEHLDAGPERGIAPYMDRILLAFGQLKRHRGFWAGINSVTLTSGLAEVPDGVPYALLHSQDIQDLELRGSCCVAFGATTSEGVDLCERQRKQTGQAVVDALQSQGLVVDWSGNPQERIVIAGIQEEQE